MDAAIGTGLIVEAWLPDCDCDRERACDECLVDDPGFVPPTDVARDLDLEWEDLEQDG